VDDFISPQQRNPPEIDEAALTEATEPAPVQVQVFGCPARDQEDELAMHMFQQLLASSKCHMEVISATTFTGEVVSRVQKERPAIVCIGALPPGGLAQTRYLCMRLRAQFPNLKVIVGRWGLSENSERVREKLLSAGADQVVTTLIEARSQLTPLIQALSHVQEAKSNVGG
jgi:CheY-like chemotaxis protein